MKRFITPALAFAIVAPFGFVGCGDEAEVSKKVEVTTPGGSTTTESSTSVDTSGPNPPPAAGTTTP